MREIILVVDATPPVLRTVVDILKRSNFQVLQARSGFEAVDIASTYDGKIDLLLFEVEMESISGPDLGRIIKSARLDLKVMLMSGLFPEDLLALNCGCAYIQKPFAGPELVEMINDVLQARYRSQGRKRTLSRQKSMSGRE